MGYNMGRIYLIRHGMTEWNKEQRSQGCSNDIPLSEEGKQQARGIGMRLKDIELDCIYSSRLQRAWQTAEEIGGWHNLSVIPADEFIEINFGVWEGMKVSDMKEQYGKLFEGWRQAPATVQIPGAEMLGQVQKRCMDKLFFILKEAPDQNIAIVSHGISIKVIIAGLLHMDLNRIHRIRQDNTALNIFEYNEGIVDIITINDINHLEGSDVLKRGSFEMK